MHQAFGIPEAFPIFARRSTPGHEAVGRSRCAGPSRSWQVILGVVLVAGTALVANAALAQAWPAKAVRMISPYPPGGGNDILSRAVAAKLEPRLAGAFVENKPGANSIIGTEFVANSPPDGYTIILIPSSHAINQSLYSKLPYNAVRDFTPISLAGTSPMLLAVPASSPLNNLRDLLAAAKARPGTLTYSTAGNGSTGHLTAVLLALTTNISLQHIPYKGTSPAVTALLGGDVAMSFAPPTLFLPHVRSGRLRALGITSATPSSQAPDVPTIDSAGVPGFVAGVWYGFLGPAKMPRPIVERLNAEIGAVLKDPDVVAVLSKQSIEPLTSTPDEFARFIASEVDKWARVVKESGAKVD